MQWPLRWSRGRGEEDASDGVAGVVTGTTARKRDEADARAAVLSRRRRETKTTVRASREGASPALMLLLGAFALSFVGTRAQDEAGEDGVVLQEIPQRSHYVTAGEMRDYRYEKQDDGGSLPEYWEAPTHLHYIGYGRKETRHSYCGTGVTPCEFNRTFFVELDEDKLTRRDKAGDRGIVTDSGLGAWTRNTLGFAQINYVTYEYYTYEPGFGLKPAKVCGLEWFNAGGAQDYPCGYFKPWEHNPVGLRIVSLESRRQKSSPTIRFKPLAIQFDHLSRSLLMLVHGYPYTPLEERAPECKTGGVCTPEGHPVISFVAINMTNSEKGDTYPAGGGYVVEKECCGEDEDGVPLIAGDDHVVTFCSPGLQGCEKAPKGGVRLDGDYTGLVAGATAFDLFSQTFYCLLTTSKPGEKVKKTLFAVARQTELEYEKRLEQQGLANLDDGEELKWKTDPALGKWEITIKWPMWQQYKWPDEIMSVSRMQFMPQMVRKQKNSDLLYERDPSGDSQKAIVMIGTVRDTRKPDGTPAFCVDKPCGFLMNQTYANKVNNGRTTCRCPAAVIQLNINADSRNAYRTIGELGNPNNADTGDEPYTVLKWLDERYPTTMQSDETYNRAVIPTDTSRDQGYVGKNIVAGVSGYRAQLPEDIQESGNVLRIYTNKSGTIFFEEIEYNKPDFTDITQTYLGENAFDGVEAEKADGTGVFRPMRASNKYYFGLNNTGDDTLVPRYLSEARHMSLFLYHSGETSKAADYSLATIFEDSLKTIGPRSYVTSRFAEDATSDYMPTLGEFAYICTIKSSYSCDLCARLGRPCAVYATAGEEGETTIFAINAFGALQNRRDDNFTVSIVGNGFSPNVADNPADMPTDGISLGPVWRRMQDDEGQFLAGSAWGGGPCPGASCLTAQEVSGANNNVDPTKLTGDARWAFPNYHDVATTYDKADGTPPWSGPPAQGFTETCDEDGVCSTRGCGRYKEGALAGLDKCVRYLKRPTVIGGGRYRVKFGIDHAGEYALETTFRGERQTNEKGELDLGDAVKKIPLYPEITGVKLIVLPGKTSAQFTIASYNFTHPDTGVMKYAPLYPDEANSDMGHVGTVGFHERFIIQAHDRFGNKRTSGGDTIDMSMNAGKQNIQGSTRANAVAIDGSELPKYDPSGMNPYAEVRSILRNISGVEEGEFILEGTGAYEVLWLVTSRQRTNPLMKTQVLLKDLIANTAATIFRGPFVTRIMQGKTSGPKSFNMHEKQTETGLAPYATYETLADENKIVAGFTDAREWQMFTLQTRDKFGNLQEGNPNNLDPINITITDIDGNMVTAKPAPVGAEAEPVIGKSPDGKTGEECPYCPQLLVQFRDDDTEVTVEGAQISTGKYLVKYRVFKAGDFTLRVTIGEEGEEEDVGACEGPCLSDRYKPYQKNTGSPYKLHVIAAATDPEASLGWGNGIRSPLQAGERAMYEVQLRDKYLNNKTQIEEDYTCCGPVFPESKFPFPSMRYHQECTDEVREISEKLCDEYVVSRKIENVEFVESSLASALVNGELQVNSLDIIATYLEGGRFTTSYLTTLAGAYDLSVELKRPGDATNTLIASLASPYILSIKPAEFDMLYTELLYWDPPDSGIPGFIREPFHTLYSSLQERTHQFYVAGNRSSGCRPLEYLQGVAGFASTFYIQRRDKYANLMTDAGELFEVLIAGINGTTGEEYYLGNSNPGSTRPLVTYMGQGVYKVEYYSDVASNDFSLTVRGYGQELKKIQESATGVGWEPISGAAGKYKVRIRTSPTDPRFCGAIGPGLTGGRNEDTLEFFIIAKDGRKNQQSYETFADFEADAKKFALFVAPCEVLDSTDPFKDPPQCGAFAGPGVTDGIAEISDVAPSEEQGKFRVTFKPLISDVNRYPLVKLEVRYNNEPILGETSVDASSPAGLKLTMFAPRLDGYTTVPDRLYARISASAGSADPENSLIDMTLVKGGTLQDFVSATVGQEEIIPIVVRNADRQLIKNSGVLGTLRARFYKLNDVGERATFEPTVTLSLENGGAVEVEKTPGIYHIVIPAVNTYQQAIARVAAGDPPAIIESGNYHLVIDGSSKEAAADIRFFAGYTSRIVRFDPAETDVNYVEFFDGHVPLKELTALTPGTEASTDAIFFDGRGDDQKQVIATAGKEISFTIRSRDRFGNPVKYRTFVGADPFETVLAPDLASGTTGTPRIADLVNMRDGTYQVKITVEKSGVYDIMTTLANDYAHGSSFPITAVRPPEPIFVSKAASDGGVQYVVPIRVSPSDIDVSKCVARTFNDLSISRLKVSVSERIALKVYERDRYGNDRTRITTATGSDTEPFYFYVQIVPKSSGSSDRTYVVQAGDATYDDTDPAKPIGYYHKVDEPCNPDAIQLPCGRMVSKLDDPTIGKELFPSFAHVVQFTAGYTGPDYEGSFLAGNFSVVIRASSLPDAVHIEGSPYTLTIQPGDATGERSQVWGPGVRWNNLSPGTVRAGIESDLVLSARDIYGNELTVGGEEWQIELNPASDDGSPGIGSFSESTTGRYEGRYTLTTKGYYILNVKLRGKSLPSYAYVYQDPSTLLIEPRPERIKSYNNTYPNPERVMDMPGTDIPGFAGVPEVDGAIPPGILVNILPGPLSEQSEASGLDKMEAAVKGSCCGTERTETCKPTDNDPLGCMQNKVDLPAVLDVRIKAIDIYGRTKTDKDVDRNLRAVLEYYANAEGSNVGLNPANDETDSSRWLQNPLSGTWYTNVSLAKRDEEGVAETEFYYVALNDRVSFVKNGYYRLKVFVVEYVVSIEDGEVKRETQITNSPFEFLVGPGATSGGETALPTGTLRMLDLSAQRRRLLHADHRFFDVEGEIVRRLGIKSAADLEMAIHRSDTYGIDAHIHHKHVTNVAVGRLRRLLQENSTANDADATNATVSETTIAVINSTVANATNVTTATTTTTTTTTLAIKEYRPEIVAQSGIEKTVTVPLRDSFGNPQKFDPMRPLDVMTVRIAEELFPADRGGDGNGCVWKFMPGDTPPEVDIDKSSERCSLLHVNYPAKEFDYSEETGIALNVRNDFETGAFTLKFTPDEQVPSSVTHLYVMDISMNGVSLKGGPFYLLIGPGYANGPMSYFLPDFYETSSNGLMAGTNATFSIQGRDKYGNNLTRAEEPGQIIVYLSVVKEVAIGEPFTVTGCTKTSARYPCTFLVEVEGDEDPSEITDFGADPTQSRGVYKVKFTTTTASDPSPDGNREGDYMVTALLCPGDVRLCSSTSAVSSPNQLRIGTLGSNVGAHRMTVIPGPAFAQECTAYGQDLTFGGITNVMSHFVIEARDQFGNRLLRGIPDGTFDVQIYQSSIGERLTCKDSNADECVPIRPVDNGDGSYLVEFTAVVDGSLTIIVVLGVSPIRGTPFQPVFRKEDGPIRPESTKISNKYGFSNMGLPFFNAGRDAIIYVQTYTCPARYLTCVPKRLGGDLLFASFTGGPFSKVPLAVFDLSVPLDVDVEALYPELTSTKIVGNATVGNATNATNATDVFAGNATNATSTTTTFFGPLPKARRFKIESAPGRYAIVIDGEALTKSAGVYKLEITACATPGRTSGPFKNDLGDGGRIVITECPATLKTTPKQISGSPFGIFVKPAPIAATNTFAVELGDPAKINGGDGWTAGAVAEFHIQPRDEFLNVQEGQPPSSTMGGLSARIIGKTFNDELVQVAPGFSTDTLQDGEFSITARDDGMYLVAYRTFLSQSYQFQLSMNGIPIANSGLAALVQPGFPDAKNTIIVDGQANDLYVGDYNSLYLHMRDVYGNLQTRGGFDMYGRLENKLFFDRTLPGSGDDPIRAEYKVAQTLVNGEEIARQNGLYRFDDGFEVRATIIINDVGAGKYEVLFMSQRQGPATLALGGYNFQLNQLGDTICSTDAARAICENFGTVDGGGVLQIEFKSREASSLQTLLISDEGQLSNAEAGQAVRFPVRPYDKYRNPMRVEGLVFSVILINNETQSRVLGSSEVLKEDYLLTSGELYLEKGNYFAYYNVKRTGFYDLQATRNGESLSGLVFNQFNKGPFVVTVGPGPISGKRSEIFHEEDFVPTVEGLSLLRYFAYAGVQRNFTVISRDAFGNGIPSGGNAFSVQVGDLLEGSFEDLNDGTYKLMYTATASGIYELRVQTSGRFVEMPKRFFNKATASFELHVLAAEPNAAQSFATGGALYVANVGETFTFKLRARDRFENFKIVGGDIFEAVVYNATGPNVAGNNADGSVIPFPGEIRTLQPPWYSREIFDVRKNNSVTANILDLDLRDNSDGTYEFDYSITTAGFYDVNVTLQKNGFYAGAVYSSSSAGNTGRLRVRAGTISTRSRGAGEGLVPQKPEDIVVKSTYDFSVALLDIYGNNVTIGDMRGFDVVVSTGYGGLFDFRKITNEVNIQEMTWPKPKSPEEEMYFESNLDKLGAYVSYKGSYDTPFAGRYEISIRYLEKHITGSPYVIQVYPAALGAGAGRSYLQDHPHNCRQTGATACSYVYGDALNEGIVSQTSSRMQLKYFIVARDIYGNDMGPAKIGGSFRAWYERGDGLTLSTTPDWNHQLRSSKHHEVVRVDETKSLFEVRFEYLKGGRHRWLTSFWPDPNGDAADTYEKYPETNKRGLEITGDETRCQLCESNLGVKCLDSTYCFADALQVPKDYFHPSDASVSVVRGEGRNGGLASDGETDSDYITCTVVGRKEEIRYLGTVVGTDRRAFDGGDDFQATLAYEKDKEGNRPDANFTMPVTKVKVVDNGDGSYDVMYAATVSGYYLLNITTRGAPITSFITDVSSNGAGRIMVLPAETDASQSSVIGLPATREVVAGRRASFVIISRDRFGNKQVSKVFQLTPDNFNVKLDILKTNSGEPSKPLPLLQQSLLDRSVATRNTAEGETTVYFTAVVAGTYSVGITIFGNHIGVGDVMPHPTKANTTYINKSPFEQVVLPGLPSAQFSKMTGSNGAPLGDFISAIAAKATATFLIRAFDAFQNEIFVGNQLALFSTEFVHVDSNTAKATSLVDNNDGTYTMSTFPDVTGMYSATVIVDGERVVESPGVSYSGIGEITRVEAYAPLSVAIGAGVAAAVAEDRVVFLVQASDVDGQVKKTGGDSVVARITPKQQLNEYGVETKSQNPQVMDMSLFSADVRPDAVAGQYEISYQIDEFGDYSLSVTLNDVPIQNSPFDLTIDKQFPPVQGNTRFTNTATGITIEFNDADGLPTIKTNRGRLRGLDDCGKVLQRDTVSMFGYGPLCTFTDDRTMRIFLGFAATIIPNDLILMEKNKIVNDKLNSAPAVGSTPISRPVSAPVPTAVVRAPERLSLCDDYTLDASGSYGTAGRKLKFSYGMMPNVPNEQTISTMLTGFSASGKLSRFTLPGSLLKVNVTYTFYVTVTNFLQESQTMTVDVVRLGYAIPRIAVEGNPVMRGASGKLMYLRAAASAPTEGPPECRVAVPEMDFVWNFDPELGDGSTFRLDKKTKTSRTLAVLPGSLVPGLTYYMRVVGSVEGRPELTNSAVAVVQALYEGLEIVVKSPSKSPFQEDLLIDACDSDDLDDPNFKAGLPPLSPFGPFSFSWSCNPIDEKTGEVDVDRSCFQNEEDEGFLSKDPTECSLLIPQRVLLPGKYEFGIVVFKEPLVDATGPITSRLRSIFRAVEIETSDVETEKYLLMTASIVLNANYSKLELPKTTTLPPMTNVTGNVTVTGNATAGNETAVVEVSNPTAVIVEDLYVNFPTISRDDMTFQVTNVELTTVSPDEMFTTTTTTTIAPVQAETPAGEQTEESAGPAAAATDGGAGGVSRLRRHYRHLMQTYDEEFVRVDISLIAPNYLSETVYAVADALSNETQSMLWDETSAYIGYPVKIQTRPVVRKLRPNIDFSKLIRPIISITPVLGGVVNSNERVTLEATLQNAKMQANVTSYRWTRLMGEVDLSAFPDVLMTPRTNRNLVFRANKLGAGQRYAFRLTATNINTKLSSSSDVEFRVNAPPSSGVFEMTPSVGEGASTIFSLSSLGWEDDGINPVEFEYRYLDPATGFEIPLVSRTRDNEVRAVMPPVARAKDNYEMTVILYAVDEYNAKQSTSATVMVKPPDVEKFSVEVLCDGSNLHYTMPRYDNATACQPKRVPIYSNSSEVSLPANATNATAANSSSAALGIVAYNTTRPEKITITGAPAYGHVLIETFLRIALGANDAAGVITLGKCISVLNNLAAAKRNAAPEFFVPMGMKLSDEDEATKAQEALDSYASEIQTKRVLKALENTVNKLRLTKEELDAFGDVYRELTAGEASGNDPGGDAVSGLMSSLDAGEGTGVGPAAAQGLLESAGALQSKSGTANPKTTAMARRALLDGQTGVVAEANEQMDQNANVQAASRDMTGKLANAMRNGMVSGEETNAVSSAQVQLATEVKEKVSGSVGPPAAPGADPSTAVGADFGSEGLGDGEEKLGITASASASNPFSAEEGSGGGGAGRRRLFAEGDEEAPPANVQGQVATFEIGSADGKAKKTVANLTKPIEIKIPMKVSGSTCRVTRPDCRYYDEVKKEWSTEGLALNKNKSTAEYIVCETTHLSSFGVSGDDVVPAFNMVDPIGDADLFTNISLENAVAIFVLGFLLAFFSFANAAGYKKDVSDRTRARLKEKIATIDTRLRRGVVLGIPTDADGKPNAGWRPSKPKSAAGGANAKEKKSEPTSMGEAVNDALYEKHEIASVLLVKPDDPFTRPQRLMCLCVLVLGEVAISAIFFGIDPSNMAMKMVIGVVTAVLLMPIKEGFKSLFEKSTYVKPPSRKGKAKKADEKTAERIMQRAMKEKRRRSRASTSLTPSETEDLQRKLGIKIEQRSRGGEKWAGVGGDGLGPDGKPDPRTYAGEKSGSEFAKMFRPQRRRPQQSDAARVASMEDAMSAGLPPPAPPPAGSGSRGLRRPTRRVLGDGSTTPRDSLGAGVVQPPPPPPLAPGAMMRPRRRAAGAIAPADAAAAAETATSPGGRPSRRGKAIPYAPADVPLPPGFGGDSAAARPPSRSRAMQALLVTQAPEGVPLPPSSDPGMQRPSRRQKAGAAGVVAAAPTSDAALAAVARAELKTVGTGRPRRRPGAFQGRSNIKTAVALSIGQAPPSAAPVVAEDGSVVAMAPQPDAVMQALVYIPPAVEAIVRRIQRVWRVRQLRHKRALRKAAIKLQAAYRGNLVRKQMAEAKAARMKGKGVGLTGLWWVTAHQHPQAKDLDDSDMAAQLRREAAKLSKEDAIKKWVEMGKTQEEAESEYAEAERRRRRRRKREMKRKGLSGRGGPKGLPRWFIYIIYVGTFIFVMAASYFIMLYGLIFEPAIGRAWLLSAAFALFMELCVQDPVKISAAAAAVFYVQDRQRQKADADAKQEEEENAEEAKATNMKSASMGGGTVMGTPVGGMPVPPPPVHKPNTAGK